MRILVAFLFAAALIALTSSSSWAQERSRQKLIEFGWDEPDTAFMRRHIAEMEKTPFDGTVFHLTFKAEDGSMQNYVWQTWGRRAFTEADFAHAIEDLKNTGFKKFTHNFLRFNTTPADVDWFDDRAFEAITGNARLAAKIARQGKAAGILFDIEQYNGQLFHFEKQREPRTFDEYAKQARRRGREVMAAFQEGFPDLHVLLTFGHTLPYGQTNGEKDKLAKAEYGLAAPFLDGLFDAAAGRSRIIDGYELSYGFKHLQRFREAKELFQAQIPDFAGSPQKLKEHGRLGFGLWMDYDWRNKAWVEDDYSRNHFTPIQFEVSLHEAWKNTDRYVWIYTETPKWWTEPDGKPEKVYRDYEKAVRRATGR